VTGVHPSGKSDGESAYTKLINKGDIEAFGD